MKKILLAAVLSAVLTPAAFSQTAISVNGQTISAQAQKEVMGFLEQRGINDEKQRLNLARNSLIEQTVIAQEARKQKVDQVPEVRQQIEALKNRVYLAELSKRLLEGKKPSEADLKKIYDGLKANSDPNEVKLAIIQVASEDQAKDIIKQLNAGADFATIAKEKSLDKATKDNGGELPMLNVKQVAIPGLAQTAVVLDKGKITPIPFKAGNDTYIIAKLLDKREVAFPEQSKIDNQLKDLWAKQQIQEYVLGLMKAAKVSEVGPVAKPKAAAK